MRRRGRDGKFRSTEHRLLKLTVRWRNWVSRLRKKMLRGTATREEYDAGRELAARMVREGREVWRRTRRTVMTTPPPLSSLVAALSSPQSISGDDDGASSSSSLEEEEDEAVEEWEEMERQMEVHMVSGGCGEACTPAFRTWSVEFLDGISGEGG